MVTIGIIGGTLGIVVFSILALPWVARLAKYVENWMLRYYDWVAR